MAQSVRSSDIAILISYEVVFQFIKYISHIIILRRKHLIVRMIVNSPDKKT